MVVHQFGHYYSLTVFTGGTYHRGHALLRAVRASVPDRWRDQPLVVAPIKGTSGGRPSMLSASLRWTAAGASALLLLAAQRSEAAGFAIFEQGARAMGFAGAYTAQSKDGSAIFHNAAGIAFLKDKQIYFGGTLIHATAELTGAEPFPGSSITEHGDVGILVPPTFYYTHPFSETLAFGIGIHAPFGLQTRWENPDNFSGRYISTKADLKTFAINPTVSFK